MRRTGSDSGPGERDAVLSHFVPPRGKDPIDETWQADLENWPEDLKEAWDERAALMEYEAGLDREAAERKAYAGVAGRGARDPKASEGTDVEESDPWDRILAYLLWLGFSEVDPAELDAYSVVPLPEEDGIDRPWRCRNPFCAHPERWWKSRHGVLNCSNCLPPAFPGLVVETGINVEDFGPVEDIVVGTHAVPEEVFADLFGT